MMKSAETAISILRKYVPKTTTPESFFEADATIVNQASGEVPFHTHTCISDGHRWACNSPYCANLIGLCPDHGGEEPVKVGREPWRGR
jgi:hypothetical protein